MGIQEVRMKEVLPWLANLAFGAGTCDFSLLFRPSTSYLCTYDLYGPVSNVFDSCSSITKTSGMGLGHGNQDFFGPSEMASRR
jgi:hypothetical protein